MRKPKSFLLIVLSLLIYFSCRKHDFEITTPEPESSVSIERFFNVSASADPRLKAIAHSIRKQENEHPFLRNFVKLGGWPVWDKSKIISPHNVGNARTSNEDSSALVYIPFVLNATINVNAVLAVNMQASDTSWHILYANSYAAFGFAPTTDTSWNAKNVFQFFALFQYDIFGHTKFLLKDERIFNTPEDSFIVTLKKRNGVAINERMSRTTEWHEVTECTTLGLCDPPPPPPPPGDNVVRTGSINDCYQLEICNTYYWNDGLGAGGGTGWTGSGWSGNGSGGGSSGGWGTTSTCTSTASGTPIACPPGWVPIEGSDPCDGTDTYSGATATLQYNTVLKSTVLQFAPFDPNNNSQDEQYFIVNDINGVNVPGPIQNQFTNGGVVQGITNNTVMVVHTHPYGSFPFPSAADFFDLALFSSNFQMHYVIGYDGTKYAMVINNYSQLQAFVNNNPGAIGLGGGFNLNTTLGLQFVTMRNRLEAQGYSSDEARERTYAYIMKQAGVTLVKAPAGSDTFKKIGIRQKVDPTTGTPVVNSNNEPVYENADC